MREYKFRGMDINGIWHYGNLAIITESISYGVGKGSYISNSCGMPFAYQVRPETVGQFTGKKDKNKKDIYENDIVTWGYGNASVYFGMYTFGDDLDQTMDGWIAFDCPLNSDCEVIGYEIAGLEIIGGSK